MGQRRQLSDEAARDIYMSPGGLSEMAEEYGVSNTIIFFIRSRRSYRSVTEGLPKPPYRDQRPSSYRVVTTEPLRKRHRRIEDPKADPAYRSRDQESTLLNKVLPAALKECTYRQRHVFLMRYEENMTLDEVGAKVNCTRERVRQIQNKAFRIIGHHVAKHYHQQGERTCVNNRMREQMSWYARLVGDLAPLRPYRHLEDPEPDIVPYQSERKTKPGPKPKAQPETQPEEVRYEFKQGVLSDYMYDEPFEEFKDFVNDELARGDQFTIPGPPYPPKPPRPHRPPQERRYATSEEAFVAGLHATGMSYAEARARLDTWLHDVLGGLLGE